MSNPAIRESLALPAVRAAWDKYRDGKDLPLEDAWLFAAGFVTAQSAQSAAAPSDSALRIAQLATTLVNGHPVTIRNMYCDGTPVGRMLIDAVAAKPSATIARTNEQTLAVARYQWARQPSNLNCLMFEFKGNTPEAVDAYIDRQRGKLAQTKS
jgi:hypothetical protein